MEFPYRVATLIYCFNTGGDALLMQRKKQPNQGLWSPCGGKLNTAHGESPHMCALRETREELGISATPADFHLIGIISEHGYANEANWLIFLFKYLPWLTEIPSPIEEGTFGFFSRSEIKYLALPESDRNQIWPLFWKYRNGFFIAHCECSPTGDQWTLEQTSGDS
ncbi:MAG: 8-oxo-dGTP diphosphatase [Verrucomicrobia subdivision 3 bacterium]|nr:8-oxo-dGTP diphosphatase [Limisphaerales bacterium]MCS1413635.1 8-oxo-dGTP diphosphatase [Limisphaerales bacterium]